MDAGLRTNEGLRYTANQFQRVSDNMEQNSMCESSPNRMHEGMTYEKIMNLRPRDRSKEIDGDMRYQAKSSVEKVVDSIKNRNALASIKTIQAVATKNKKGLNSIYFKKNMNM